MADGTGGVMAAWTDLRDGETFDVYAQHVSAAGVVDVAWAVDGQLMCGATGDQYSSVIVSDGGAAWKFSGE